MPTAPHLTLGFLAPAICAKYFRMQLSLFEDNRTAILLNIAEEYLRSGDLPEALAVYDELLSDTPGDRTVIALREQVDSWLRPLSAIAADPADLTLLQTAWERLDSISVPALHAMVLELLIEALDTLPDPALIFTPPDFHLGQMLLRARRFREAADAFQTALANPRIPKGMLLAWRSDALTLAGEDARALTCCLAALLEDPASVDLASLRNRTVRELAASLDEALEEPIEDRAAWLPVWGWLHDVFPLPPAGIGKPSTAAEFQSLLANADGKVAGIWYEMLGYAERVRTARTPAGFQEVAAIRRLMKQSNGFFFACYLQKINARN